MSVRDLIVKDLEIARNAIEKFGQQAHSHAPERFGRDIWCFLSGTADRVIYHLEFLNLVEGNQILELLSHGEDQQSLASVMSACDEHTKHLGERWVNANNTISGLKVAYAIECRSIHAAYTATCRVKTWAREAWTEHKRAK